MGFQKKLLRSSMGGQRVAHPTIHATLTCCGRYFFSYFLIRSCAFVSNALPSLPLAVASATHSSYRLAEAVRQFEAKLKRAERERTEAQQQLAQLTERFDGQRRTLALKDALASQPFIDADDARVLIERGVQADGDGFVFQGADGKVMGLQDAAAWLAKTKPYMVAAPHAGSQGSGFKPGAQGAGGGGNSGNAPTLDVAAIYAARASKPAAA